MSKTVENNLSKRKSVRFDIKPNSRHFKVLPIKNSNNSRTQESTANSYNNIGERFVFGFDGVLHKSIVTNAYDRVMANLPMSSVRIVKPVIDLLVKLYKANKSIYILTHPKGESTIEDFFTKNTKLAEYLNSEHNLSSSDLYSKISVRSHPRGSINNNIQNKYAILRELKATYLFDYNISELDKLTKLIKSKMNAKNRIYMKTIYRVVLNTNNTNNAIKMFSSNSTGWLRAGVRVYPSST